MSDLAATNCGNGCGCGTNLGGNDCCSIIWIILLLSCFCGGNNGSFLGGNGDGCGCGNNSCLWIILLLLFCGGGSGFGGNNCGCNNFGCGC